MKKKIILLLAVIMIVIASSSAMVIPTKMICPELRKIRIDLTKAEQNGWVLHPMGDRIFKEYSTEVISPDAPAGHTARIFIIFDEWMFAIITSFGRDDADPPNQYRCNCPPDPPIPCFEYSQEFKINVINEVKQILPMGGLWYNELLWLINQNKSIMGLWPHPDDECYTPGIFPLASSKGNKCWVVVLISLESIPPEAQELRRQAIEWFEEQYLEEYINLNMTRDAELGGWHGYTWSREEIKVRYKAEIEEKQPDILLTFTPYGYMDNPRGEHALIQELVTEIWYELSYEPKPKIFWFVNTDQGPRNEIYEEYRIYPPTAILNLNRYSEALEKTYWEAKVEFWEHYAPSMPSLERWMSTPGNLENNDRREYYIRHK